jgi:uncharacterized protein YecT (DUF1311 family)
VAPGPIAVTPPVQVALAPAAPGRLEALPPEMTAATQAAGRPRVRPRPQSAPADDPSTAQPEDGQPGEGTLQAQYDALLKAQSAPAPAPVAARPAPSAAPAPQGRASFDCTTARPGAEQMVCADPQLAADDRQMARVYGRAVRSGMNPAMLSREQQDWVAIREDAAHRSRQAVAQAYDQRIRELERMADRTDDDDSADDGE